MKKITSSNFEFYGAYIGHYGTQQEAMAMVAWRTDVSHASGNDFPSFKVFKRYGEWWAYESEPATEADA